MIRNVLQVIWGYDTDPAGRPMAMIIYTNRTWNTFYHHELGAEA